MTVAISKAVGGHRPPLHSNRYNLDLRSQTYYIKRVLRPLCSVALCLAALTSAFGQANPTSAPAVSPRPLPSAPQVAPSAPSGPATTSNAQPPAQTSPAPASIPGLTPVPDKTVTLQFPNSDVVDVLHLYEQLTNT